MRKIYTLFAAIAFMGVLNAQTWNISTDAFNALGAIATTTTVEGLSIYSDGNVSVDANNKSLEGIDYTHRLKLGGAGNFDEAGLPVSRVIAFDVTGNASITVMSMSSSSSSDRSLNVAAGGTAEENLLGTADALGASLTATTIEYTGAATTIYIWSPSSGVNVYAIKAEAPAPVAEEAAWNISTDAFNALGDIATTTAVEGLTIYSDGNVSVDANNKSLEGIDYTHRLKLGGAGNFDEAGLPVSRVLAFEVAGNASITVMCMSSSSSSDRSLNVAAGGTAEENLLGTADALGASLTATTIEYTGAATTIYIWSPSSGVNVYNIVVKAGGGTTSIFTPKFEGRVVSTEYYNISGMKVDNRFDVLPAGIYIEVSRYENGAIATEKVIKNRK